MEINQLNQDDLNIIEVVSDSLEIIIHKANNEYFNEASALFFSTRFIGHGIYAFVKTVYEYFCLNEDILVLTFIYLDKASNELQIDIPTIYYLFFTSCMIAKKFVDDRNENQFFNFLEIIEESPEKFAAMEKVFLESCEYELYIMPEELEEYKENLKIVFENLI